MPSNKELLQAARMIQEHCKSKKYGDECIFSNTGKCGDYCSFEIYDYGDPTWWNIPDDSEIIAKDE